MEEDDILSRPQITDEEPADDDDPYSSSVHFETITKQLNIVFDSTKKLPL